MAPTAESDAQATARIGTWLILINVAMFFLTLQLDPARGDLDGGFRPSNASLIGFGANVPVQIRECGQFWRLLTANFLHVDLMHLVMNSVCIFILIPLAAVTLGLHRMLCIYFVAGVFGSLVSHAVGNYSVGASGAVSGLIGALAVYGKRRGAPHLTRQMLGWGAIILLFGFLSSAVGGPSIDNWGHIGGFAGGAALGWPAAAVRARGSRGDRMWARGAYGWLAACAVVLAFGLLPSVLHLMERRDIIVYDDDATRTLKLMDRVAHGEAAAGKLPETFPVGPANSGVLAERMREALGAVRGDPRGAAEPVRQATVALLTWRQGLACSHNLRWRR